MFYVYNYNCNEMIDNKLSHRVTHRHITSPFSCL